jgi:hypothetical protein
MPSLSLVVSGSDTYPAESKPGDDDAARLLVHGKYEPRANRVGVSVITEPFLYNTIALTDRELKRPTESPSVEAGKTVRDITLNGYGLLLIESVSPYRGISTEPSTTPIAESLSSKNERHGLV